MYHIPPGGIEKSFQLASPDVFCRMLAAIAALAMAASVWSACGDDETSSTSDAQATDGAFITEMIAHHQSAIEMAKIGQRQAEHSAVERLARDILAAQGGEIDAMEDMHERMFGESAMGAEHGDLGLDDHMMGMDSMDMGSLARAQPFDEAFIDEMIPHHQGAIRMAQIVLAEGEDDEVRSLAQGIIDAQSEEIERMNHWRKRWYGERSPAGGIPDPMQGREMPPHEDMGH